MASGISQPSTTSALIDLEIQRTPTAKVRAAAERDNDDAIRAAALQHFFNLAPEKLLRWPGLRGYCQYLELCFQPLLTDEYACIWTTVGIPRPKKPVECWPWFRAVNHAVRSMEERNTITDVLDAVKPPVVDTGSTMLTQIDKTACLTATFAVLCWSSMTLQPMLSGPDSSAPGLWARRLSHSEPLSLKLDAVRRPIGAAFRNFPRNQNGSRWRQPICDSALEQSSVLHVSTLNFQSLQTIGKIRLSWVDELSSHLDFESRTRTLSIFRYPSFCALTTVVESRGIVFEGIARSLYSADVEYPTDFEYNLQLNQEVLMSYRLLFGQERGSRKCVRTQLQSIKQRPDFDEFLERVCCQNSKQLRTLPSSLWPISCRKVVEDTLQEEGTYNSQDDFPLLGQRLAKLQEYNLRQQPSRLRDLWRDRRNLLTWYTFWVVLIFGTVSIAIALLQLAVAIIAIPTQGNNCNCGKEGKP